MVKLVISYNLDRSLEIVGDMANVALIQIPQHSVIETPHNLDIIW